jgi:hypothetical protein
VLTSILAGDRGSINDRMAAILAEVLEQPELHQRLTGVVRAAASEPDVARMLREFLTRELYTPATELLGSDDGPFRVNLVGSQIVRLVMARYVVQIEPLASMPPKTVAATVAPTLERYLLGQTQTQRSVSVPAPSLAATLRHYCLGLQVDAELAQFDDRRSAPADRVGRERERERHPVLLPQRLPVAQHLVVAGR